MSGCGAFDFGVILDCVIIPALAFSWARFMSGFLITLATGVLELLFIILPIREIGVVGVTLLFGRLPVSFFGVLVYSFFAIPALNPSLDSHFFSRTPPTAPGAPHRIADITAVCVSPSPNILRFCIREAALLRPFSRVCAPRISRFIPCISTPFFVPASSSIFWSFDLFPEASRFPTSLTGFHFMSYCIPSGFK